MRRFHKIYSKITLILLRTDSMVDILMVYSINTGMFLWPSIDYVLDMCFRPFDKVRGTMQPDHTQTKNGVELALSTLPRL